jgi:hypothetical protein
MDQAPVRQPERGGRSASAALLDRVRFGHPIYRPVGILYLQVLNVQLVETTEQQHA